MSRRVITRFLLSPDFASNAKTGGQDTEESRSVNFANPIARSKNSSSRFEIQDSKFLYRLSCQRRSPSRHERPNVRGTHGCHQYPGAGDANGDGVDVTGGVGDVGVDTALPIN